MAKIPATDPTAPTYGFTAPNGATLAITPRQVNDRQIVEIDTDNGRATSVLLYLTSATATKLAEDIDRAVEAADRGDTTVHGSEPRLDVSGDSITVTPGPDDGIGPRVTIAAVDRDADDEGDAAVVVEVPTDEAVDLAAAIRTAARTSRGENTQPQQIPPAVGDQYTSRAQSDRTVIVTRVWTDEYGHTAVAYEWHGGVCASSVPLAVFLGVYEAAEEQPGKCGRAHATGQPCPDHPAVTVRGERCAHYPHPDGEMTVLGPEVIAAPDGAVIWWKGEHYTRPATDATDTAEDTARRFARRLYAVETLCAGRPGYHTVTVKQVLTAMSDADEPQAAAPHITRGHVHTGIRTDCRLCGAYNIASDALHRSDDADAWTEAHADACTPDSVRQTAAGLRAAVEQVRDLAAAGDPALWDEGDGQRARLDIVERLRARALELDTAADEATGATHRAPDPANDDGTTVHRGPRNDCPDTGCHTEPDEADR